MRSQSVCMRGVIQHGARHCVMCEDKERGTNENKDFFGYRLMARMTMKHQAKARKREEFRQSESIGTCRAGILVRQLVHSGV
jgi:predicted metal-binding protein